MALGFQRIHDVSPLSLKSLNDQLDQLWKKVMGGLETRDMTGEVAAVINQAVTQGNFTSMIQQYGEEIRLAVGRSAGDNMIMNGNASFAQEGWEALGCELFIEDDPRFGSAFATDGEGAAEQGPLSLKAQTDYVLFFRYLCPQGVEASLEGAGVAGESPGNENWAEMRLPFRCEEACEATLRLSFGGAALFTHVTLYQDDGGYRQNPNEVRNSSITLSDQQVAIDTRNFALRLYNAQGQAVTEMTADEQGFSRLYIAENLVLRGKPFYLGEGEHHLWVHPDAPQVGERRIFSSAGEPVSLEGCFPDIQQAVDAIPRWCDGAVTVHIYGGGAWQYPSSKLVISHFFGGGRVALAPWTGQHYTLKRVEVNNNSLVVDIQGADINACGAGDCYHVENSTAMLYDCRVNGRYLLTGAGSAGYDATYGALLLLSSSEAHQCHNAAHAHLGGRIFIENCKGTGNYTGVMATTGGLVQQSGSTFGATTLHHEGNGGVILSKSSATQAGTPPTATPMEYALRYEARRTGSVSLSQGRWITSPDWPQAGENMWGLIWFDQEQIHQDLWGKSIVHASLTLRRRGEGGRARSIGVSAIELFNQGPEGSLMLETDHGPIGSFGWGEKKTVALPVRAAQALADGFCKGFALGAQEDIAFEGVSEHPPVLEIIYR